jgi:hypothetical protein
MKTPREASALPGGSNADPAEGGERRAQDPEATTGVPRDAVSESAVEPGSPKLIGTGIAVIVAEWSHGLVEPESDATDDADSGYLEE